ncbi:MAG: PTS sugar transporter subunit IIC [Clostridia bacterium]|nr:PTS sugar transporter subunit IIC [Clostridia bacterium]
MKKVKGYLKKYFIDAMGAMAQGLFASLLIGTIFKTIGQYLGLDLLVEIAGIASGAAGMAIGAAIACSMKAHPLVIFSAAAAGSAGYSLGAQILMEDGSTIAYTAGPAGAFFAVIVAVELGMLVSKKTKVDILVTPTVTILSGFAVAKLLCPGIAYAMYYLGDFINTATTMQPFVMGIIIAAVVGIILTLPISSAAICAMIGISGLAGGAATVGCCAQMVGFAVISFRENGWNGVVSQGLGTSMLQMGNICRRPQIWIPPTLAGAICGPISTLVFKLECTGVSAGMGTCGLVGPLGILSDMGSSAQMWVGTILCCVVLPGVLALIFSEIMRKLGWIREGDMKLDV